MEDQRRLGSDLPGINRPSDLNRIRGAVSGVAVIPLSLRSAQNVTEAQEESLIIVLATCIASRVEGLEWPKR